MKENGKLPESFNEKLEELSEQYEYFDYTPPPPLAYVWKQYWKIRRTKPFEHPVNYTDLHHFENVNAVKLNLWEIDVIIKWDGEYYHYCQKHKE